MMDCLLAAGCPVDTQSSDAVGMYPMHWTCTEGHLPALKWVSIAFILPAATYDAQCCTVAAITLDMPITSGCNVRM
jgi:hypothetical protein